MCLLSLLLAEPPIIDDVDFEERCDVEIFEMFYLIQMQDSDFWK